MITIDRAAKRHYEQDGQRYFSVSQVLGVLGKEYGHYGPDEADRQRGHDVHQIFSLLVRGGTPIVPEEYRGYYESMQHWIEQAKPEAVQIETPSVSGFPRLPFAGTPDLLARIQYRNRRVLALIEVKTGAKEKWHKVQVRAYERLWVYRPIRAMGLLYVHADGRLATYTPVLQDPRDWLAFQHALSVLIWRESG